MAVQRETKKNISDHFQMENIPYSGRMSQINFLDRLYTLRTMPSTDGRYENAYGDVWQHTENNFDYDGNWVFHDSRFELLDGSDEKFLKFLCEMIHPLVRTDNEEIKRVLNIANSWLSADGWELYPIREIAGGNIYSYRTTSSLQISPVIDSEVAHIWMPGKLRVFISHRDRHKVKAKELGLELNNFGLTCFVAHDSIQAMSTWKNEIMKALQTSDAFICYITADFYESEWTNQEVGYAIARGIPVYLYSVDKTDPKGFKLDTQAIKSGTSELINCIKKDFLSNSTFKNNFITNFENAVDGSFENAKNRFFDLISFNFQDEEIDRIAAAFGAKAKYTNQLNAVLRDHIKDDHKKHPKLKSYTYYREYLINNIFKMHSSKNYIVLENPNGNFNVAINKSKRF